MIFESSVIRISNHNLLHDLGLKSYRLAINKFSDQSPSEVYASRNGFMPSLATPNKTQTNFDHINNKELPDHVDWRIKGIVTPVKDQGHCGSCWAFATVAALEGQQALATKKLISLSEQNLVDCSKSEGNHGCGGGYPERAYQYIIDNCGIDTEMSYPYDGDDETCAYKKGHLGATMTSYVNITAGDEMALKKAVATIGPISVAIDATSDFMAYSDGIYDSDDCGSSLRKLNHAVTVVGYGTDGASGQDYWIVKNSWGSAWGQKGYIQMSRNKNNQCGIATDATYPIV